MRDTDVLLLRGSEVDALIGPRRRDVIEAVRAAYELHAAGRSRLPHSTFVKLPGEGGDRAIALPAYLGGESPVAGIKWITSFPSNVSLGIDRASAVIVLNSTSTGRPTAILEGSVVSARRTAASAALAALELSAGEPVRSVGFVGCGLINFETLGFLAEVFPALRHAVGYDVRPDRAERWVEAVEGAYTTVSASTGSSLESALADHDVVSIATTASTPHVRDVSLCRPGCTILHVSLRDLTPDVVLRCDNVVDDLDHVRRAETSIDLAARAAGHARFVRCSLGEILAGSAPARPDRRSITVFSPFGLGILDLAVARLALELASKGGVGTLFESFLPESWSAHRAITEAERASGRAGS